MRGEYNRQEWVDYQREEKERQEELEVAREKLTELSRMFRAWIEGEEVQRRFRSMLTRGVSRETIMMQLSLDAYSAIRKDWYER